MGTEMVRHTRAAYVAVVAEYLEARREIMFDCTKLDKDDSTDGGAFMSNPKVSAGALRAAEILTPRDHPGAFALCGDCRYPLYTHNDFDNRGCDEFVDSKPERAEKIKERRHEKVVSTAQIIDRETGVGELLEAAKGVIPLLVYPNEISPSPLEEAETVHRLEQAIAKCDGKGSE